MGNTFKPNYSHSSEPKRRHGIKSNHKVLIIWHLLAVCYYISSSFCNCAQIGEDFRLVDLSHTFDNSTIYWVTQPSLELNVTHNGTLSGQDDVWYQVDVMSAATHGGTHMDAPCHLAKGRWTVAEIPLDHLVVPAAVIDISHHVKSNPNVHLTKDMLLDWESLNGPIREGSLMLIYTGWSRYWPDRLQYSGTMERDVSKLKFPSILPETAEWIVSNRNVVGVGIDTMSVDRPNMRPTSHITLFESNVYALENVNNLELLPPTGAMAYIMPMKLKGASGAPCRIVAQVPKFLAASGGSSACTHILLVFSIIVITYMYRI